MDNLQPTTALAAIVLSPVRYSEFIATISFVALLSTPWVSWDSYVIFQFQFIVLIIWCYRIMSFQYLPFFQILEYVEV